MTSSTLFWYGEVLLGPEVLVIAQQKITMNNEEKRNRIVSHMKQYYEREYKYSLVKAKYELLTDLVINSLATNNLKVITNYISREDDRLVPNRKSNIL